MAGIFDKLALAKDIVMVRLGKPMIFSITLNMTDKCNLRCKMCSIWKRKDKKELSPEIFEKQMKNSKYLKGIKLFNFAGGEPFLVNDLEKFVDAIVQNSRPVQIRFVTNGFLTAVIKKRMEYFLNRYKNTSFGVKISLDGLKEVHDNIRGVKGAFDNVIRTIDALNELKSRHGRLGINLGFTVNKLNFNEVDKVYKLAREKKIGFLFKPVLRIKKFSNEDVVGELFLDDDETRKLKMYNEDFIKTKKIGSGFFDTLVYKHFYRLMNKYLSEPKNYMRCYALSASCYIIPNGDVTSCLLLNDVFGNINERDFDRIWLDAKTEKRRHEIKNSNCHCLTPCDTIPSLMVDKFPFY